ncbi:MAG: flagellar hook-basal body complex protein FliE [Bryobacteraceae bacterium]
MSLPIAQINHVAAVEPIRTTPESASTGEFQALYQGAVNRVEASGKAASQAVESFLSGEGGEVHTTILSTQRAALELEMFLQVRNKVVQAYQEIMRMQV